MGGKNKTDRLDAKGLATLLRNGTLPDVWIPPAGLRDLRGLMRTRLATRSYTTALGNRTHAALRRCSVMAGEPPVKTSHFSVDRTGALIDDPRFRRH